jgi:hypothetical protein
LANVLTALGDRATGNGVLKPETKVVDFRDPAKFKLIESVALTIL